MGQIKTKADIKQLGTILSVWAHPDDESFSCAGIMAAAIANGQTVICITATKGEAGVRDESRWPSAHLAEIRAKEMEKACQILGVSAHHWLGYHDGQCHEVDDEDAADKIKIFIERYKPDTILTWGPEGMTGHLDHQAVSRWVDIATKGTNIHVYHSVENEAAYENYLKQLDLKFNIYFNIDMPPVMSAERCDIAFQLTSELVNKKHDALTAMPSQTEEMFKDMPDNMVEKIFGLECYVTKA